MYLLCQNIIDKMEYCVYNIDIGVVMNQLLSLVLPCYNEEEIIAHTLDVLAQKMTEFQITNYEIVIVDDGSRDKSLSILQEYAQKDSRIKVVSFAANRGQQMALYAGMCYSSGDAVVLMDADLQDPPECIPEMITQWKNGYQVIYGKRISRKGDTFMKSFTAKMFYAFYNWISEVEIPQNVGDFRLLDRSVVDAIVSMEEKIRFNKGITAWLGFKQTEVYFDRPDRVGGETKYNYLYLFKMALDGIFSFSYFPIKFLQGLGAFSMFISSILVVYIIISKYVWLIDTPGWSSLMIVIVFFSGSLLFGMGILGEYIRRIHLEVIKRPLFVSAKTFNLQGKALPPHVAMYISPNNKNLN